MGAQAKQDVILDTKTVAASHLHMHDGGLLEMAEYCHCANREVRWPMMKNLIEFQEATHCIYRLPPFGYGKDVLRACFKINLADLPQTSARVLRIPAPLLCYGMEEPRLSA